MMDITKSYKYNKKDKPNPSLYIVEYIAFFPDGTIDPDYKSYLVIENHSARLAQIRLDKKNDKAKKYGKKISKPKYKAGLLTVLKQALRFAEIENSQNSEKWARKIEINKIKLTNGSIVSLGMAYRKLTYRRRNPRKKFSTDKKFNSKSKFNVTARKLLK